MPALMALLLLASHRAAGLDLGCDNLCLLRGLWLSCRLHIDWSKNNEFKNEPNACHSAHEHVLSACFPHCSRCDVESLGAGCANEATTIPTNTSTTTTIPAAITTIKAATTTTQLATTTTKAAATTNTTTSKTTARTTSRTATSDIGTDTTTRLTTRDTSTFTTTVIATKKKITTRSTSTSAAGVELITKMGDSTKETAGSHKRGAIALNASQSERHPAVTASGASSVTHSPSEIRNPSADAADAAIDKHHIPSTTRGTSENMSVNGPAGKFIKKIPGTNHSNDIPSHTKSSNKSNNHTTKNNRTAGPVAAGAPAARNTSSNRTTPHTYETIATETTTATETVTETTTTTLLESFCCSAALDDANFCGTCWENAPLMNDKYCRASKESCEDCGHVWCNRTDSKGSCKKIGCVDFLALNDCQCNPECVDYGSCCDDYVEICAPSAPTGEVQNGTAAEVAAVSEPVDDSCAQLGCTDDYRPAFKCQCNDACEAHGSCCLDYWDQCAAFAKKHEVGVRFLTTRMGVIAMVVPSALALTALLGWLAARRGWLTYSGRSLALRAMAEGKRLEGVDAQVALMQPTPGEAEFMSSL